MTPSFTFKHQPLRVAIVGGGIGGLTAALAFRRIGADVQVFERAPEIREVGAGVGVWANAIRVLDELGVGEQLREFALPVTTAGIYSAGGRPLSVTDVSAFTERLGVPTFVVHRAALQRTLLDALPADTVTTGAECCGIDDTRREAVLHFEDRDPYEADLVVGADGFNSIVRRELWGDTPVRYSGQVCFRGVVRMRVQRPGLLAEIQGRGIRMGHCPFSADRMYWWACHNAPRHQPEDPRAAKARLLSLFRDWPFQLEDAIAATPADTILRTPLCDRQPLTQWSSGAVTLLGDAAHPMVPNLGQGACTAIEDAAVLARCVAEEPTIAGALARYESLRIPRTTRMVELAWRFGHLARWSNPLAVALRESLLRLTPASVMEKEFSWQLDYDAGTSELLPTRGFELVHSHS